MAKPLINDRYQIVSVIRKGSQATLYHALDEWMGACPVALGIYDSFTLAPHHQKSLTSGHSPMEIFKRIRHPNLISVLGWGVTNDGHLFNQMALSEGDLLPLNQPALNSDSTIKCMIQILSGLNYLHSNGLIHGNLTPGRLFWQKETLKLFGYGPIFHFLGPEEMIRSLNKNFTAPEVLSGNPIDLRCDLYSLGAIFFALLTGRPPNYDQWAKNETVLDNALEIRYEVSPDVKGVIRRLLSFCPEDRYPNGHAVTLALGEILGNQYIAESLTLENGSTGVPFSCAFVGRQRELTTLSRKLADDSCNGVLITGRSGIGKSNLLAEFTKAFQSNGGIVVRGLCIKEEGVAYRPMREILRMLVEFLEASQNGTPAFDAREASVLATLLPELWERDLLEGFEEPAKLELEPAKQRLNSIIFKIFSLSAEIKPTLIVIEDLQWADEATLFFLDWFSTLLKQKGLLICITCRTFQGPSDETPLSAIGNAIHKIKLTPLSKMNTKKLIGRMLHWNEVPKLLVDRVHGMAEGNIFFVKSLLRYLTQEGNVLHPSAKGWAFNKKGLNQLTLPHSFSDLLHQVFLSLSEKTQHILRLGAVMGSVFWDNALMKMGNIEKETVRYALGEAIEKEMVLAQNEVVFEGNRTFIFTQPEIQHLCYGTIPIHEIVNYHKRAAAWLKKKSRQRPDEYLGIIADHYEKARLQNEAMNYLMQAGAQVASQFAHAEAMDFLIRALKIAPLNALVERYTILLAQDDVLNCQGDRKAQQSVIEEMASLVEELDDDQRRIEVMIRKLQLIEVTGHYEDALEHVKALISLSDRIQSIIGLAEGYYRWGATLWRKGDYLEAIPKLKRTLSLVRASNLQIVEANTLRIMGNIYRRMGNYTKTMAYHESALVLDQKNYDPYKISIQTMNIGLIFVALGDYESASRYYNDALKMSRKFGIIRTEMFTFSNWAELETLLENFDRALVYANKAYEITIRINHPRIRAYAVMYIGDALHGLNRNSKAKTAFKEGYDLFMAQDQTFEAMKILTSMADIALKQKDLNQCREMIEQIVSFEKEHTLIGASEPFRVYLMLYKVLCELNDNRAMTILETACELLTRQAEDIKEERYRKCFLEAVIAHRELMKIHARIIKASEPAEKSGEKKDGAAPSFKGEAAHALELKEAQAEIDELNNTLDYYKQAEETLWESEKRFRSIAENASEAIIIFDDKENVQFWNQAAEDIFGYSMAQPRHRLLIALLTRNFKEAYEEEIQKVVTPVRQSDRVGRTMIVTGVKKDGKEFPLEISVSALKKEKATLYTVIGRDITERKRVEKALKKAKTVAEKTNQEMQKVNNRLEVAMARSKEMTLKAESANRAKSEFLANMSHEIRTPMNAIIGMTYLALDTDLSDEQSEFLRAVGTSADNLLTIINDILDFSKIEAGHLELENIEFDLEAVMNGMADTLAVKAHEKGLELLSHIEPNVPLYLKGDPVRLRQILLNLGGNAIKFTEKGEVFISIGVKERSDDTAILHFSVADTGIGIEADKKDTIFESFRQADGSTTRKYGGTGLGLSISKQLVHKMEGEIWIESEMGRGSIFHFTTNVGVIPKDLPQVADLETVRIKGRRVLIVDDNAHNRMLLKKMLTKWELVFDEAADGETALRKLNDACEKHAPHELILMDAMMPGLDGFQTCEKIRMDQRFDECIILMLTSMGLDGMIQKLKSLKISAHILKPIKQSELLKRIKTLLAVKEDTEKAAKALKAKQAATDKPLRSLKILLAEDNTINQMMAVRLLEKLGHQAIIADNGMAALESVQSESFDLILMDVQMPEMDGFESTRRIRQLTSDVSKIPIIAMTAYAMKGDKEKCFDAGMNDYIAKPIEPDLLAEKLNRWSRSIVSESNINTLS